MTTTYASAEVSKGQKETPKIGTEDNGLSKIDERYLDLYVKAGEKFGWEKVGRNIVDDGLNKPNTPAPPEKLVRQKNATLNEWLHPPAQVKYESTTESQYGAYEPVETAPSYSSSGTGYESVTQCESGGDYTTDTGNGYYGAYQFDQTTWDSYAPEGYAGTNPAQAPPEIQDQAAANVDYDAWPNC